MHTRTLLFGKAFNYLRGLGSRSLVLLPMKPLQTGSFSKCAAEVMANIHKISIIHSLLKTDLFSSFRMYLSDKTTQKKFFSHSFGHGFTRKLWESISYYGIFTCTSSIHYSIKCQHIVDLYEKLLATSIESQGLCILPKLKL